MTIEIAAILIDQQVGIVGQGAQDERDDLDRHSSTSFNGGDG